MKKLRLAPTLIIIVLLIPASLVGFFLFKSYQHKQLYWLPSYFLSLLNGSNNIYTADKTEHVIFLITDHHEHPMDADRSQISVTNWTKKYRENIAGLEDHFGNPLQYSWFYPIDHHNDFELGYLDQLVFDGLGEIELHWHHSHNDTAQYMTDLHDGINRLNHYGAILSSGPEAAVHFGFIHGNWALDNSDTSHGNVCGINDEISRLKAAGSYADFTFSTTRTDAQPEKFSSLYYAIDTPEPKSHNTGINLSTTRQAPENGYLIFEGPSAFDIADRTFEHGELEAWVSFSPHRAKLWVDNAPYVEGQPKWRFIKVYTHAVQSKEKILSKEFPDLISSLKKYCESKGIKLHFATAREAYNIAKAAESGATGNPESYRDFLIPKPVNRMIFSQLPINYDVVEENHIELSPLANGLQTLNFKHPILTAITGQFDHFTFNKTHNQEAKISLANPKGVIITTKEHINITNPHTTKRTANMQWQYNISAQTSE